MSGEMICPKGRDGVCVGGELDGMKCGFAYPHECVGARCSIFDSCPTCVSASNTPLTFPAIQAAAEQTVGYWREKAELLEGELAASQAARKELLGALKGTMMDVVSCRCPVCVTARAIIEKEERK